MIKYLDIEKGSNKIISKLKEDMSQSQTSIDNFPEPLRSIFLAGICGFVIYWFIFFLFSIFITVRSEEHTSELQSQR